MIRRPHRAISWPSSQLRCVPCTTPCSHFSIIRCSSAKRLPRTRSHFIDASVRSATMPKTLCVPIFNGMAQGCLPLRTRLRSQATSLPASPSGSSAANSGTPGLKWSYSFSRSSSPAFTSPCTRSQREARLLRSATRTMSSNAIHSASQRAISLVTAWPFAPPGSASRSAASTDCRRCAYSSA